MKGEAQNIKNLYDVAQVVLRGKLIALNSIGEKNQAHGCRKQIGVGQRWELGFRQNG